MGSEGSTVIAAYRYDAFNRRIIKTVDQTTYRYTYDDWNIVEISTSANDYINIIDHGMDNHIAIEVIDGTNSEIYYFLSDERGNVVALTDEIGNIVERYRYLVYGEHVVLNEFFVEKDCGIDTCYAGNLHNFLWGGSMYEPETDLYWMRNRYYHKGMKRFINQDPIGIWGDANNLGNGFAYVAGMVIEATDPTGLETDFNYFVDKNEINNHKSPIDAIVVDIVSEGGLKGFAGGLGEAMIKKIEDVVKKKLGIIGGAPIVYFAVTLGVMAYQLSELPDIISEMSRSAQSVVVEASYEYGFGKDSTHDQEYIDGISKDGKSFVKTLKFKDDDGNEWAFQLTYGKDGNEELHVYKNGKLVKKYKWGVIGKDDKGNNIFGWIEVEGSSIPSDPYDPADAKQSEMIKNVLQKMLRIGGKSLHEEGPVISVEVEGPAGNPRKVFIRNPYYRGQDPMKEVIWRYRNPDGSWGFIRNPFAPGGDYDLSMTTYEKIRAKGFVQPEVDPYFN
jgi:RHS repeat-associated protein